MIQSRHPRKQRKWRFVAPLHARQKWTHVHLVKALRTQYKKRSMNVRKGDTVKILRGHFKGRSGKVVNVDVRSSHVFVEGVVIKKQSGKEILAKLPPSNLIITELMERKK